MEEEPSNSPRKKAFSLPVDSTGKATEFRPFTISSPHMLAFHLAWISLFANFFSTFSIPPLIPVIRADLNLTESDIETAGIAAFVGSIFSRFAMGPVCDLVGPRIASATLSLLTAPVVLSTAFVSNATSFILVRFLLGFCLANFVANQFWMSCMFSGTVVGLANGVAAGWANVGAGLAQLAMPSLYNLLESLHFSDDKSWRVIFVVPAILQSITAIFVLFYGQDLPSGNFRDRRKTNRDSDGSSKENFGKILFNGILNYRGWILALAYGFSFGVELTTNNIIVEYFYDRFGVSLEVAGTIAACFGMANLFSRPLGGILSDKMGEKFGMRGRLWGLWAVQTVGGVLCVVLGRVNSLGSSFTVMFLFSVFVQAASGLNFGVVPFVSKRSLGVISGMTGSGGTVGAVVNEMLFFSGDRFSKQTSISLMGLTMILCTLPISLIYFPQWGGMFCFPPNPMGQDGEEYHLLE